jgi:hypothetical protein
MRCTKRLRDEQYSPRNLRGEFSWEKGWDRQLTEDELGAF